MFLIPQQTLHTQSGMHTMVILLHQDILNMPAYLMYMFRNYFIHDVVTAAVNILPCLEAVNYFIHGVVTASVNILPCPEAVIHNCCTLKCWHCAFGMFSTCTTSSLSITA